MKESISKSTSCLMVFSSEGIPVMVVPATSVQDAMTHAQELLRDEKCLAEGPIARSGVSVTMFAPAIYGGDEVLGFLPVEYGESSPGNQPGRHRTN
jgi:hypothetical protein